MPSILVIDDKDSMRQMLSKTLELEGYEVEAAKDGERGLEKAKEKRYDLVLADLKLPKMDGLEVLSTLKELDPEVAVIMMTAYGTIESAVKSMKEGAFDFVTKPFDTDHLNVLIKRALENRRLLAENILLREELT
ncbi:MAG: response regulator, partial [candidate division Zixibacteria bacterium]|nr:response regulator [candidate division Zixibacteria bacterium]